MPTKPKKRRPRRPSKSAKPETGLLFPLPERSDTEPSIPPLIYPVWTESKANFIARYLYYFVLVTKHGVYIDAFAGPQQRDKPGMWAAQLVLDNRPPYLRSFYFMENDPKKVKLLENLRDVQPKDIERTIEIYEGDCNVGIQNLLQSRVIKEREATFCLLDQHTFECKWQTLERLARYKSSSYKIELFYFLCNSWLARALTALQDRQRAVDWWGAEDVEKLRAMTPEQRANLMAKRFKDELGYKYASPYPICERKDGGNVMFYMIHATDHLAAPTLMGRAYNKAVSPREPLEQLKLELGIETIE